MDGARRGQCKAAHFVLMRDLIVCWASRISAAVTPGRSTGGPLRNTFTSLMRPSFARSKALRSSAVMI